jgi:hypothetical protein
LNGSSRDGGFSSGQIVSASGNVELPLDLDAVGGFPPQKASVIARNVIDADTAQGRDGDPLERKRHQRRQLIVVGIGPSNASKRLSSSRALASRASSSRGQFLRVIART